MSDPVPPDFIGTRGYWDARYERGGDSGSGSSAHLAEFKAEILNQHVRDLDMASIVELGCGDGRQLELAEYPRYLGLDISPPAVRLCAERFAEDATKSFAVYDPSAFSDQAGFFRADLAISLDVIFHLVEDELYHTYLDHLFGSATRSVVVYASDHDGPGPNPHVRHRNFTQTVKDRVFRWDLVNRVPNRYPVSEFPHPNGSFSDFYFYEPR